MKSKIIVAVVMSAIMLCSCSDKTSGETDFTESDNSLSDVFGGLVYYD